ncbi:9108_t:CDS:1, partial [Racocetra fulgida]
PLRILKPQEVEPILYAMHSDPLAGHFNKEATYQRVITRYFWPQMRNDIRDYV